MGVVSGKFCVLNGIAQARNWSINDSNDLKTAVASNTKGGTVRGKGVGAWSGSFESYGGIPSVLPGETFAFEGYAGPDNGVAGTTGLIYSGNAIIDQVAITLNWNSGDFVGVSTNFSGKLALTSASGQAAIHDDSDADYITAPDIPTPSIQVNGTGGFVPWPYITQLTYTLKAANQAVVNSSTAGQTDRLPGVIDWEITATEQEVLRNLFDKNDELDIRLYINATQYWRLAFGKVKDFTNIVFNRETGVISSRSAACGMTAYNAAGDVGAIRLPGAGSDWWPVSGA